jgi:hypothetical protein
MNARPRKVDVIVLGRGLAAAAAADALALAGRRVALLAEAPGWERGVRPGWQGWYIGQPTVFAAAGAATLERWQAEGLPGLTPHDVGHLYPLWLVNLDELLPALGERIGAAPGCWVATETQVRGVSVIENGILGAIAEDSRYDARHVVNASEDERHAAYARMMRKPHELELTLVTPHSSDEIYLKPDGVLGYPEAAPYWRDDQPIVVGPTSVQGAWRVAGVAGRPTLAIGAALHVAEQVNAAPGTK